ncbi:hypothetical protein [Zoogloea sp.]|uniref:hypothetical protein n=1 Tax=Zoogloea sp. TaxID=49181 RepID=UPI0035B2DD79
MNRFHARSATPMKGAAAAKPCSAMQQSMLAGERSLWKGELLMFARQHKGLASQTLMFEVATLMLETQTFMLDAATFISGRQTFLRSDEVFLLSTETKGSGAQPRPHPPERFLRGDAVLAAHPAKAIAEHHDKTVSRQRAAA